MAPVNRKEISLYQEAKSGFTSLIQQTAIIFVGFIVMLLVTAGTPSSFTILLSFCLGIVFVAWSEQRRIKNLRLKTTYVSDPKEEIALNFNIPTSNIVEWNILKWFEQKSVPEEAKQIGGWSLLQTEARPRKATSLEEGLLELIPLVGAFSIQQRRQKHLTLGTNLKIQKTSYILRISSVGLKYWSFDLETVYPGLNIPRNFELCIGKNRGHKWTYKISKSSLEREKLSVQIPIAKGDKIVIDIKPRPENYIYQVLNF